MSMSSTADQLSPWSEAEYQSNYFCTRVSSFIINPQIIVRNIAFDLSSGKLQFLMYIYQNNDIVSNDIARKGSWDLGKLKEMVRILEKFRVSRKLLRHQVNFIDIGANVGWFSTVLANIGYSVVSFEPMPQNELILRKNQCEFRKTARQNTWIYVNKGLGATKNTCKIISRNTNLGDGVTECGENVPFPSDFSVRAVIDVDKLDMIIPRDKISQLNIGMVKIDVENYEKFVIEGGQEFFKHPEIKIVFLEFLSRLEENTKRNAWVYEFMTSNGFILSRDVGGQALSYEETIRAVDVIAWKP